MVTQTSKRVYPRSQSGVNALRLSASSSKTQRPLGEIFLEVVYAAQSVRNSLRGKNELRRQRARLQGAQKNLLLKLFFRQFNDMPIRFVGKPQNREIWVEMEKRRFKE
jgi:hypothetical protein